MEINTNYSSTSQSQAATSSANTKQAGADTVAESTQSNNNTTAAVYESSGSASKTKQEYKADPVKVKQMMAEMQTREQSLTNMIKKLLNNQAEKNARATGVSKESATSSLMQDLYNGNAMVEIDEETRSAAQADIAEDGYFGVKKTTERIMDFAKAITGGDPAKAESMRKAVQKGFDLAAKQWGGELPQISQDTHAAVMQEFDKWMAQTSA